MQHRLLTQGLLALALAIRASSFALPQLGDSKLNEREDPTEPDVGVGATSAPNCKIAQATYPGCSTCLQVFTEGKCGDSSPSTILAFESISKNINNGGGPYNATGLLPNGTPIQSFYITSGNKYDTTGCYNYRKLLSYNLPPNSDIGTPVGTFMITGAQLAETQSQCCAFSGAGATQWQYAIAPQPDTKSQ